MTRENTKRRDKVIKYIDLPDSVSASANGKFLLIKGPKGEVRRELNQHNILMKIDNKKIIFESKSGTKEARKLIGSFISHVKNMVKGSLHSHVYTLKICSGHFPMNVSVSSNKLVVKNFLGGKVPKVLQLKDGADVKIEGDLLYVTSINKELAGQVSADIERLTRRPGYDTRIFQDGIYVINKDGRELK